VSSVTVHASCAKCQVGKIAAHRQSVISNPQFVVVLVTVAEATPQNLEEEDDDEDDRLSLCE
jgi:hypothetical protein